MIEELNIELNGNKALSIRQWHNYLFNIFNKIPIQKVNFVGFEPSSKEGFYSLLQFVIDNVPKVSVSTNGIVKTRFSDSFSEYEFDVVFLLESIERDMHNLLFNDNELITIDDTTLTAYDWLIKKLKVVTNNKIIKVKLYENTDILRSILFADFYQSNLIFDPYINLDNKIENFQLVPTSKKMAEAYSLCNNWNVVSNFNSSVNEQTFLFTNQRGLETLWRYYGFDNISKGGRFSLFIDHQGFIYPDENLRKIQLGNINKFNYSNISKKMKEFTEIMHLLPFGNKCNKCVYKNYCGASSYYHWHNKKYRNFDMCPIPLMINSQLKNQVLEVNNHGNIFRIRDKMY